MQNPQELTGNKLRMSEEVKNVHREPHPFVGTNHMANFVGRPIAFVGKIDKVGDGELIMHQNDSK